MDMDTDKQRQIWTPTEFQEQWLKAPTDKFDDLAPSWYKRRGSLTESDEDHKEFLERLKREHAIETGIVEKLYDLSDGITETFIKEGFVEAYLGHDDTNIAPGQLMAYLTDHFKALDFVFTVVQNNRKLSKSFIKELHALLTDHQRTTTAVNGRRRIIQIELLKGEFKKHPNNPRREDGTLCLYCPPEQVDSEMDRLLNIYEDLNIDAMNPIVVSAWFHHAFTKIHPFQDGNGRMARLLSSLIWIKAGLFPLTVKRAEKSKYIKALESADEGDPNQLVAFFSEAQSASIDGFLNYKKQIEPAATLADVAGVLGHKVAELEAKRREKRQQLLSESRKTLFDKIFELFGKSRRELAEALGDREFGISLRSVPPEDKDAHWYAKQIVEYAKNHRYYFNKLLPRFWFRLIFVIPENKRYDLIVTVHHSGYDDSVMAIGAFLEFFDDFDEKAMDGVEHTDYAASMPIDMAPYKVSLETITSKMLQNIESYILYVVKIGLTVITNEIG